MNFHSTSRIQRDRRVQRSARAGLVALSLSMHFGRTELKPVPVGVRLADLASASGAQSPNVRPIKDVATSSANIGDRSSRCDNSNPEGNFKNHLGEPPNEGVHEKPGHRAGLIASTDLNAMRKC
jgi:hypothetical protein